MSEQFRQLAEIISDNNSAIGPNEDFDNGWRKGVATVIDDICIRMRGVDGFDAAEFRRLAEQ